MRFETEKSVIDLSMNRSRRVVWHASWRGINGLFRSRVDSLAHSEALHPHDRKWQSPSPSCWRSRRSSPPSPPRCTFRRPSTVRAPYVCRNLRQGLFSLATEKAQNIRCGHLPHPGDRRGSGGPSRRAPRDVPVFLVPSPALGVSSLPPFPLFATPVSRTCLVTDAPKHAHAKTPPQTSGPRDG